MGTAAKSKPIGKVTGHRGSSSLTPGGQRVLEAASVLFYGEGIHRVGVAGIAAAAGVTKKSLYDTFGSKDQLITAYLQGRCAYWERALEECLSLSPMPRVLAFFDAQKHGNQDHSRGCAFINAAGELPAEHDGRHLIAEHKHHVRTRIGEVINTDAIAVPHRETLADHVFLLHEGALAQVSITGTADPIDRARRHTQNLLSEATRRT